MISDPSEPDSLPRLLIKQSAYRNAISLIFNAIAAIRDVDDTHPVKLSQVQAHLKQLQSRLDDLKEIDQKIQALSTDDALESIVIENGQFLFETTTQQAVIVAYCSSIKPVDTASTNVNDKLTSPRRTSPTLAPRRSVNRTAASILSSRSKWILNRLFANRQHEPVQVSLSGPTSVFHTPSLAFVNQDAVDKNPANDVTTTVTQSIDIDFTVIPSLSMESSTAPLHSASMVATELGLSYLLSDLHGSDPQPEVPLSTVGAEVVSSSTTEEEPQHLCLRNVINDNQYDALLSSQKDEPIMSIIDSQVLKSLFCIPQLNAGFIMESIHFSSCYDTSHLHVRLRIKDVGCQSINTYPVPNERNDSCFFPSYDRNPASSFVYLFRAVLLAHFILNADEQQLLEAAEDLQSRLFVSTRIFPGTLTATLYGAHKLCSMLKLRTESSFLLLKMLDVLTIAYAPEPHISTWIYILPAGIPWIPPPLRCSSRRPTAYACYLHLIA